MANANQVVQAAARRQPSRLKIVILLTIACAIASLVGGGLYWRSLSTSHADYDSAHAELARQVSAARADGYSDQDLAPALQALNTQTPGPSLAASFERSQLTQRLVSATAEVPALKTRALAELFGQRRSGYRFTAFRPRSGNRGSAGQRSGKPA